MEFTNSYDDNKLVEAYAKLEFPDTYYLAYRDLPEIIYGFVQGGKAMDFGCGTGRSTGFLQKLGFDATGVDISEDMIKLAKKLKRLQNSLTNICNSCAISVQCDRLTVILRMFGRRQKPG